MYISIDLYMSYIYTHIHIHVYMYIYIYIYKHIRIYIGHNGTARSLYNLFGQGAADVECRMKPLATCICRRKRLLNTYATELIH